MLTSLSAITDFIEWEINTTGLRKRYEIYAWIVKLNYSLLGHFIFHLRQKELVAISLALQFHLLGLLSFFCLSLPFVHESLFVFIALLKGCFVVQKALQVSARNLSRIWEKMYPVTFLAFFILSKHWLTVWKKKRKKSSWEGMVLELQIRPYNISIHWSSEFIIEDNLTEK